MSLRGHVSSIINGRSEIKNLINELITEIEREHGLSPSACATGVCSSVLTSWFLDESEFLDLRAGIPQMKQNPPILQNWEPLLQHRQLHRIFWTILCTAIYYTVLCLPFYATLCVARLLSGRCVSPPSGAIRNQRPIL